MHLCYVMLCNVKRPFWSLIINSSHFFIFVETCSNSFSTLLSLSTQSPVDTTNLCPPWEQPPPRGQRYLWTALRKASLHYQTYEKSFDLIGRILHDKATEHLVSHRGLVYYWFEENIPMLQFSRFSEFTQKSQKLLHPLKAQLVTVKDQSSHLVYPNICIK